MVDTRLGTVCLQTDVFTDIDPHIILMSTTSNSSPSQILLAVLGSGINDTTNGSLGFHPRQMSTPHGFIDFLERITSPIVCLVGTLLNLMTVGTFLSRPLKRISCCLYLATRSLAVFGFLVSVLIALTPLMNSEGVCEVTVFLSYFCPFVSVWMVVIISVENLIRISQPSRVSKLCTPRVAKFVIGICLAVGLVVYNFPFWTSRIIGGNCGVTGTFFQVVLVYNYIDAMLTLFCPFLLMLIVVPLVALSAISAYERKKRLASSGSGGGSDLTARIRQQATDNKSCPETRVTRLLFAVSVVFLLLHAPFHAIRVKVFILAITGTAPSRTDGILLHVFRLIYNLDTCVSCAVYLMFGDNFRRVFCKKYFSSCQPSSTDASLSLTTTTTTTTTTASACTKSDTSVEVKINQTHAGVDDDDGGDDDDSQLEERLLSQHNHL